MQTTVTMELDVSETADQQFHWTAAFRDFAAPLLYTYPDDDGQYVEIVIDCHVSPGEPARLYGPPEDCDPGSGPTVYDRTMTAHGKNAKLVVPKRLHHEIAKSLWNAIEQQAIEGALPDAGDYE